MKKFGRYLTLSLLGLLAALAVVSTGLRIVLLTLDDVHPLLSRWASEAFEVQMEIGQAVSEWRGVYPAIILDDVTLKFEGTETVHRFGQVAFNLDLLKSLFSLSLVPERISVTGGAIRLRRLEDGGWGLDGMPTRRLGPALDLPVDAVRLRKVATVLHDQGSDTLVDLGEVDMDLAAGLWGIEVLARNQAGESGDIDFELRAEFDSIRSGKGLLRVGHMRLAQLMPWLPDNARGLAGRLPADLRMQAEAQLIWDAQVPQLAGMWVELERPRPGAADWKRMAATLKWRTLEKGYAVALEQLQLDQHTVAEGVYLEHDEERIRGYLSSLDIRLARQVAAMAGYPMEDFFPDSIASGTLFRLSGEIQRQEPLRYRIHAGMKGLEISMPKEEFLLTGLAGTVDGSEQGIRFSLDSGDLKVSYAPWGLNEFRPGATKFQLDWWPAEECCVFELTGLQVSNPALRLHGGISMGAGGPRRLHADIGIEHADLPAVSQWVPPDLLLEADDRWVRSAFKAGRLSDARLRLGGPLSPGMLTAVDSELTLTGSLHEIDLDYEPGLPMFESLEGEIFLDKERLHVLVREARIEGSILRHGALRIGDLSRMDMHSSSVVEGPVSDVPEFLERVEWMAPTFNHTLKFDGNSTLDLQLNMPLDNRLDHKTTARGVLRLHNNRLEILPNDSRMDKIQGEMQYREEMLTGSLDAQFMGRPAHIELMTVGSGDVQIKMQASASLKDYLPQEIRPTFSWLDGPSAWDLVLLLPGVGEKSRREHLTVLASSDFRGTRVDLPKPLDKPRESEQPLEVKADIEFDGEVGLAVKYADRMRARIQISPEEAASGTINLGSDMPSAPADAKLRVTGRMAETRLQDWIDWKERHAGHGGLWPEISGLKLGRLKVSSLELDDVEVSARFAEESDQFAFDSSVIRGMVDFPKGEGRPVQGAFEWLRFSEAQLETVAEVEGTEFNPQGLPPLDFEFRVVQIGTYELRDARLMTSPGERRANIDRFQAKSHKFNMDLGGYWSLEEGKHLTLLQGMAHTDSLHETLNHWSVGNPLRKGVFDMDLALQWPGAPHDYEFENLQGYIDIKGKDGRIRNVAPEFARILALLNLEMIFDRLSLDFDDVVRGGFTYQTAEGKFDFLQGHLNTSEFRIIGPSAQFLIVGRIGVEDEDYDLTVVATPETSVLIPAVGAVGGPIGVAGAYIGTKVLEWLGLGIDEATAVTYRVTGPWSDPIIEEVTVSESESE